MQCWSIICLKVFAGVLWERWGGKKKMSEGDGDEHRRGEKR